jgi:hypothetical protein
MHVVALGFAGFRNLCMHFNVSTAGALVPFLPDAQPVEALDGRQRRAVVWAKVSTGTLLLPTERSQRLVQTSKLGRSEEFYYMQWAVHRRISGWK